MKNFLQNRFAQIATLQAIMFASFWAPGLLGKMIVIVLVIAIQYFLEKHDDNLKWDVYDYFDAFGAGTESKRIQHNVLFSLTKLMSFIFIIGYVLFLVPTGMLDFKVGVLVFAITCFWFLLYYGSELLELTDAKEDRFTDYRYEKLRRFITMAILTSSLAMSFLYFGTWYVWISSAVSLLIYVYGMLDSVVDEVFTDEKSETIDRIKKLSYVFALLLPFLIGIISMADQASVSFMANFNTIGEGLVDILSVFYYGSIAVLTYQICIFGWCFPIWLIPLIALLSYIYKIVRKEFEIRAETKRNEIEKAVEAKDVERLKDQKEKQMTNDLLKNLFDLAIDAPVTQEHLFFFAKNRSQLRLFPIKKLCSFCLKSTFTIHTRGEGRLDWKHDLEEVLALFNELYKNTATSDEDAEAIYMAVKEMVEFLEQHKQIKTYLKFKEKYETIAPDIAKLLPLI